MRQRHSPRATPQSLVTTDLIQQPRSSVDGDASGMAWKTGIHSMFCFILPIRTHGELNMTQGTVQLVAGFWP